MPFFPLDMGKSTLLGLKGGTANRIRNQASIFSLFYVFVNGLMHQSIETRPLNPWNIVGKLPVIKTPLFPRRRGQAVC